ncbi:MAG: hypothetical protein KAQ79_13785 [Cyclobacteriaceae bacterium]|nr:hypothetical protein [Cyclobacteriaceae bacterium]
MLGSLVYVFVEDAIGLQDLVGIGVHLLAEVFVKDKSQYIIPEVIGAHLSRRVLAMFQSCCSSCIFSAIYFRSCSSQKLKSNYVQPNASYFLKITTILDMPTI